jgi:hypothetical protein
MEPSRTVDLPALVLADTEESRSVTTRLVAFARSTVAVDYQGDQAAALVDFLFGGLSTAVESPPQITFRLLPGERPGELALHREGDRLYTGYPATMAEHLLGYVGYELADHSRGGLLFHAAALAWQGCGILLPAFTGAGKSTLTAWLLGQGFSYLTDELAFVPAGSVWLHGFTRPLSLKSSGRAVLALPPLTAAKSSTGSPFQFLHSPHLDLISPALLGISASRNDAPLRLIVFPQYQAGAPLVLHPLSGAQAGKALLECLINARNLPDHGFFEVTRLAHHLRAYRLTYGHFNRLNQQLTDLLADGCPFA